MPVLLMRILSKSMTGTLSEKCRDFSEQLSKFLPGSHPSYLAKELILIRNFAAGTKFPARDTRLEV